MSLGRFLRYLEPAEESALLAAFPQRAYAAGEVVLEQDVKLRAIYVVDEGAVRVERRQGQDIGTLATLRPGEFFGEMSFVEGTPTSARVVAATAAKLRLIDLGVVDNLSEVDPIFGSRLYRSIAAVLAERLRLISKEIIVRKPWV